MNGWMEPLPHLRNADRDGSMPAGIDDRSPGPVDKENPEIDAVGRAVPVEIGRAGLAPSHEEESQILAVDQPVTVQVTGQIGRFAGVRHAVAVQILAGGSDALPGRPRRNRIRLGQHQTETIAETRRAHRLRTIRVPAVGPVTLEDTSQGRAFFRRDDARTRPIRQATRPLREANVGVAGLTGGAGDPLYRQAVRSRELNTTSGAGEAAGNGLFAVHASTIDADALKDPSRIKTGQFVEGRARSTDAARSQRITIARRPGESLDPVARGATDCGEIRESLPSRGASEDSAVLDEDPVSVRRLQTVDVGTGKCIEERVGGRDALIRRGLVVLHDLDSHRHDMTPVVGNPDLIGIIRINEELQMKTGGTGRQHDVRKQITIGSDAELERSGVGETGPGMDRVFGGRRGRGAAGREHRLEEIESNGKGIGRKLETGRRDLPLDESSLRHVLAGSEVAGGVRHHDWVAPSGDPSTRGVTPIQHDSLLMHTTYPNIERRRRPRENWRGDSGEQRGR